MPGYSNVCSTAAAFHACNPVPVRLLTTSVPVRVRVEGPETVAPAIEAVTEGLRQILKMTRSQALPLRESFPRR